MLSIQQVEENFKLTEKLLMWFFSFENSYNKTFSLLSKIMIKYTDELDEPYQYLNLELSELNISKKDMYIINKIIEFDEFCNDTLYKHSCATNIPFDIIATIHLKNNVNAFKYFSNLDNWQISLLERKMLYSCISAKKKYKSILALTLLSDLQIDNLINYESESFINRALNCIRFW